MSKLQTRSSYCDKVITMVQKVPQRCEKNAWKVVISCFFILCCFTLNEKGLML